MVYEITLQLQSRSSAARELEAIIGSSDDISAILCRWLNQDAAQTAVWWDHNRSSVCISTPRLFVVAVRDSRADTALTVISAKSSQLQTWKAQQRRKVDIAVRWSPYSNLNVANLNGFIEQLQHKTPSTANSLFWTYWEEFAKAERSRVDQLCSHRGWPYKARRHGTSLGFEFQVEEEHLERIIGECRSRILIGPCAPEGKPPQSQTVFELLPESVRNRWICASPLRNGIELKSIPETGRIYPDWTSLISLQNRRINALHQLRLGKTAMPGLSDLLPDGPQNETSKLTFSPKILPEYNSGQRDAIEKGLVPHTLTSILGPPGTGKTAVIAEIAAQAAGNGARVLISSQSNLAVDNALERLISFQELFIVRVGRAESVKLNPELILSASSPRYRDRILSRSEVMWKKEEDWFLSIENIPTSDEIRDAVDGIASLYEMQEAADEARTRLEECHAALQEKEAIVVSLERELEALRKEAGIAPEQDRRLKDLVYKLAHSETEIGVIIGREQQLRFAMDHRQAIQNLEQMLSRRKTIATTLEDTLIQKAIAEQRLARANALDLEIEQKKVRNQQIERERAKASGFWDWLNTNVFTWKDDIAHLETARKEIKVHEEQLKRDRLRNIAEQVTVDRDAIEVAVTPTLKLLGMESSESSAQKERLDQLLRDLNIAEFVLSEYGTLKAATDLLYWKKLSTLTSNLTNNRIHLASARENEANAHHALDVIERELNGSFSQRLIERFQNICPPDFDANAWYGATLEVLQCEINRYWDGVLARYERAAKIETALRAYHLRLSSERIDLEEAIIADADVIAATCTGIAVAKEFQDDFDCVVIDEAGKAAPLDLLIPMVRGRSIVLVGDHRQLPPMLDDDVMNSLRSDGWDNSASKQSLFERLFTGSHACRKAQLSLQYRMVPPICDVVKKLSYEDVLLEPAGIALNRQHPFQKQFPCAVLWIRCQGTANRASRYNDMGTSPENEAEAKAIVEHLKRMAATLYGFHRQYEVGVIAMYRGQVARLRREIAQAGLLEATNLSIELGTVDAFQGRQKDAILVSLVETDPNRRAFFYDIRRVNVALSRARELLIVVGSVDKLGKARRSPLGGINPMHTLSQIFDELGRQGDIQREVYCC